MIDDTILRSFILFVQTAYAILKYANAHLYRKAHLSISKLIVLRVLASNKEVTPSEIAKWTYTERHNITTLIERMKRDGLVRTERNPRNRRFVNIQMVVCSILKKSGTMQVRPPTVTQTETSEVRFSAVLVPLTRFSDMSI